MTQQRQFKFRAWDSEQKKMVTQFLLAPTSPDWSAFVIRQDEGENKAINNYWKSKGDVMGGHYTTLDWSDYYGIEKYTVMQFSGRYDKNNKEIFEGDVFVETLLDAPVLFYVIFKDGMFQDDTEDGNELRSEEIEVIGNIYEHPELLEQVKSQELL